LLGKRYADYRAVVEVLATRAGVGTLTINGNPMDLKNPKGLPASD
jgi:hypothetical protein